MTERLTARNLAGLAGVAFLLVGIGGFIPGITESYDQLEVWKNDSQAELLYFFQTSVLHNAVHLAFGVLGLALARTEAWARLFLLGGGAAYLALWIYGLAIDKASGWNWIPVDRGDDWLHFLLGALLVVLGLVAGRALGRRPAATP